MAGNGSSVGVTCSRNQAEDRATVCDGIGEVHLRLRLCRVLIDRLSDRIRIFCTIIDLLNPFGNPVHPRAKNESELVGARPSGGGFTLLPLSECWLSFPRPNCKSLRLALA
jgi:hypothetical protein